MTSARPVGLSLYASVAARAALPPCAQAISPGSVMLPITGISFASNHGFLNTTSLQFGNCTGSNAAGAVSLASGMETADAAGAQNAMLRSAALSRINTSQDRFADQGISPALSAGFAMRRGRRGVDIVEF